MEKIYRYKKKDVLTLIRELDEKKGKSLSEVFVSVAQKTGKTAGTIRNMYYDLAKNSCSTPELKELFLTEKTFVVKEKKPFLPEEEKHLIKEIIKGQCFNRSVRSTTLNMSRGDAGIALRFQNKYRSVVRNNPSLIKEVTKEITSELNMSPPEKKYRLKSELQYRRLISEIDGLIGKISLSVRNENETLKSRIKELESQLHKNKEVKIGLDNQKVN